jgi:hypothetical protein
MSEVTDFIAAVAAIAKDPEAWEERLGNIKEATEKLAEAKRLSKQAVDEHQAAAKDLETARYERGQAERASRDIAAQNATNQVRERDLRGLETELNRKRQAFDAEAANWKANVEAREKDLEIREALATKKLADAQKLMAAYDEAKHQAALKLAS